MKSMEIPIYSCKVVFKTTPDITKDFKTICKKHGNKSEFEDSVVGLMFRLDCSVYYVFVDEENITMNTVAHEIFHLVRAITEDRYITDEEAQAWLMGYMMEHAYLFFLKDYDAAQ